MLQIATRSSRLLCATGGRASEQFVCCFARRRGRPWLLFGAEQKQFARLTCGIRWELRLRTRPGFGFRLRSCIKALIRHALWKFALALSGAHTSLICVDLCCAILSHLGASSSLSSGKNKKKLSEQRALKCLSLSCALHANSANLVSRSFQAQFARYLSRVFVVVVVVVSLDSVESHWLLGHTRASEATTQTMR